jgi:hypothetical protein
MTKKQQKSKQLRLERRSRPLIRASHALAATVVCVSNAGYPASLEKRKIYLMLPDSAAEKHGLIRVVDESGDDYVYSKTLFRSIVLPQAVKKAVLAAA